MLVFFVFLGYLGRMGRCRFVQYSGRVKENQGHVECGLVYSGAGAI